jgi:L-cystine uptake protein TcyP (sodium:dicarboxylate symporter family)
MALLAKKQKPQTCVLPCQISKWTVCALLFVVALAALVGVFQTHFIDISPLRIQFGSTGGSLSILAFTVAIMAWGKKMSICMSSCAVCTK